MRKLLFIAIMSLIMTSCGITSKNRVAISSAKAAAIGIGQELKVQTDKSSIYWRGSKPGGDHEGELGIMEGSVTLSDDHQVTAGSFVINMKAITNDDLKGEPELQAQLIGHLSSEDFFDVAKYPTAQFTITEVEELTDINDMTHLISGNLKIKDVEKNISFRANIAATITKYGDSYKTVFRAGSELFSIDRTEWNIRFGSKKLFPDLKDHIVNDDIELRIIIVAEVVAAKE